MEKLRQGSQQHSSIVNVLYQSISKTKFEDANRIVFDHSSPINGNQKVYFIETLSIAAKSFIEEVKNLIT